MQNPQGPGAFPGSMGVQNCQNIPLPLLISSPVFTYYGCKRHHPGRGMTAASVCSTLNVAL